MAEKDEKLNGLNTMLMGVENKLMGRALERDRAELDHATDFINNAAEQGVIDIDCTGGEDEGEGAEGSGDGSGEALPVIPEEPPAGLEPELPAAE